MITRLMGTITHLGRTRPVYSGSIYVPPSAAWQVWSEAGGDATQADGADDQMDDLIAGSHWTSPASANYPNWQANGINSKPAWSFNGNASDTTGSMFKRVGLGYTGDCTGIFVIRPTTLGATRYWHSGEASSKTRIWVSSTGTLSVWNGGTNANFGWNMSVNTNYVIAIRWKSGEGCKLWVNGVETGSTIAGHTQYKGGVSGANNVILGRDYTTNLAGFAGLLSAIGFVFSSVDPVADSQTLMTRYGIS